MFSCQSTYLLSLLVLMPFLSSAQSKPVSEQLVNEIDLAGKTFTVDEEESNQFGNELNLYLIFYPAGRATFRAKRGNTITSENSLSWRFVGDSLYIQNGPVTLVTAGKKQSIARAPMKYSIEKIPGGYLLKDTNGQTHLFEVSQ